MWIINFLLILIENIIWSIWCKIEKVFYGQCFNVYKATHNCLRLVGGLWLLYAVWRMGGMLQSACWIVGSMRHRDWPGGMDLKFFLGHFHSLHSYFCLTSVTWWTILSQQVLQPKCQYQTFLFCYTTYRAIYWNSTLTVAQECSAVVSLTLYHIDSHFTHFWWSRGTVSGVWGLEMLQRFIWTHTRGGGVYNSTDVLAFLW